MSESNPLKNNFRGELSGYFKRLADASALSHGYVFYGPMGVGRNFFARCLAGYLENGSWNSDAVLGDFYFLNPAGDSIGIDDVRSLKQVLYQTPLRAKKRTAAINQAERLTDEAQNALLKVAEETPSTGLLIMTVRDPDSLRDTLRSRFQPIHFGPVSDADIKAWLESEHGVPDDRSGPLSARSFGLPGRALALWHDEAYLARLKSAAKYLDAGTGDIRAILNEVLLPEDFSLRSYLDDLISVYLERKIISEKKLTPEIISSWHGILELRRAAEYLNLSPRIQLNNLKTILN